MVCQKCSFTLRWHIYRSHLDLLPVLILTKGSLKCNIRRTPCPLSSVTAHLHLKSGSPSHPGARLRELIQVPGRCCFFTASTNRRMSAHLQSNHFISCPSVFYFELWLLQEHVSWKKVKMKVTQSCPTPCDPIHCRVHGILQARILDWIAFLFSRGSSQPRDQTQVSLIAGAALSRKPDMFLGYCPIRIWPH